MNTFYNDDFQQACNLYENSYSHQELMSFLRNGNIQQKQYAAIKLENIFSEEDAAILFSNLTGCDGKIREAVAIKIHELLVKNPKLFDYFINFYQILADATIDINANICRQVINTVSILISDKTFFNNYSSLILNFIEDAFCELDKFIYKDKKYVINKQLFKLYWCLEALKLFAQDINKNNLYRILNRAIKENEYTIREKVAEILAKLKDTSFDDLKDKLKQDENYFVRKAILNH